MCVVVFDVSFGEEKVEIVSDECEVQIGRVYDVGFCNGVVHEQENVMDYSCRVSPFLQGIPNR